MINDQHFLSGYCVKVYTLQWINCFDFHKHSMYKALHYAHFTAKKTKAEILIKPLKVIQLEMAKQDLDSDNQDSPNHRDNRKFTEIRFPKFTF